MSLLLSCCCTQQLPQEGQGKWIPTTNLTSSACCQERDKALPLACPPLADIPSGVSEQGSSTQQALTSLSLGKLRSGAESDAGGTHAGPAGGEGLAQPHCCWHFPWAAGSPFLFSTYLFPKITKQEGSGGPGGRKGPSGIDSCSPLEPGRKGFTFPPQLRHILFLWYPVPLS